MDEYSESINVDETKLKSTKNVVNDTPLPVPPHCFPKNDERALQNYTTWLRRRDSIHKKLSRKIKVDSGDLLMNTGDRLNEIKEEKAALEYTKIPQKFDKYRGNPAWWNLPLGLREKDPHGCNEMRNFYKETKLQKNEIPLIEKVGMPYQIQREKMLMPRTRNVNKMWQNSEYRKRKIAELSDLLKNIVPHDPNHESLMVVGKKIQRNKEKSLVFEKASTSSEMSSVTEVQNSSVYDLSLNICLKINGLFFYENSPFLSTVRKFYVLFEYNTRSEPLQTKYITFENVGRVTLRIYWREMRRFRLFQDIARPQHSDFFCFNKNMLLLVPGQIINLPIWFQTKKLRTVVETWEITTLPEFWRDPIRVFFVLQAQAQIENFMLKIKRIKHDIELKVKKRIIQEVLNDAIAKSEEYSTGKTVDYSYHEPQIFEASNFEETEFGLRQPKYSYDKAIVQELKEFYPKVRQIYHPTTWNLNVKELQVIARVQDLIEYAEERTLEFRRYRKKNLPSFSSHQSDTQSTIAGKRTKKTFPELKAKTNTKTSAEISQFSDQTFMNNKETHYSALMKILFKFNPPSCVKRNEQRTKYFHVYSIFCAYFSIMSQELYDIKPFSSNNNMFATRNPFGKYPRLIFETSDHLEAAHCKRSSYEDNKALPKSALLKNVASEDVQKIYKLYFHSGAISDANSSEKTTKATASSVSKSNPSSTRTAILNGDNSVSLDFDPYSEITLLPFKNTSQLSKRTLQYTPSENEAEEMVETKSLNKEFNIYVTVYHYLEEAIDAMVDSLESAIQFQVTIEDLEGIKDCFPLFKETESIFKSAYSVNPFTDPYERDYFERILSAHVNDITGSYLICGKTEPIVKEQGEEFLENIIPRTISDHLLTEEEDLTSNVSVFTIPRPVEETEVYFKDSTCQTSLQSVEMTERRYEQVKKVEQVDEGEDLCCLCPPEFRAERDGKNFDLYYSDDEEIFEDSLTEDNNQDEIVREREVGKKNQVTTEPSSVATSQSLSTVQVKKLDGSKKFSLHESSSKDRHQEERNQH